MDQKHFNVAEAIAAQRKYCEEKKMPHFAPRDGVCWRCYRNIYKPVNHGPYTTGISVEDAGNRLVTGCPHCCRSYCD